MVGPTPPLPQLQTQPPAPSSAEDEALKRNTDCVYFLASPLTCKKGSECEYRHSDMARLNPRDCWYWLHGNCLNPKCAFRHPPLDGFLEAQAPTVIGSSVAPVVSVAPMPQVPYASSKQGVPCVFFQRGICSKGDNCAFMHAPNSISSKPLQPPVSTASSETPIAKNAFGGIQNAVQGKKLPQTNHPKPSVLPKPVWKLENHLTKKENTFDEKVLPPNSVISRENTRYKPTSMPATNGNSLSGPNRVQQPIGLDDHSSMQNKDDEISREPSPGFDVLVDDELRGSDYYHEEDQYGGTRSNGGRNEYDMGDSADYDSVADIDRDMYRDGRGYDSYDRLPSRYAWEQPIASSERIPGGSAHLERRRYGTVDRPEQVKMSDLRHRLSKHRRGNGLKSVIGHDFSSEKNVEDRANKSSRRDAHYVPSHDSSLSGRLRGRIKLPVRSSSPTDRAELRLNREMDRARYRGRLSSERPQLSSYQGRLQDRIKGRVQEDLSNGDRNNRGPRLRKDIINDNNSNFVRPKSLVELKVRKTAESNEQNLNEQQHLGKRKFQKLDSGEDQSFKGPMSLQEILKRKRGGGAGMTSGGSEDYEHERKGQTVMTSMTTGNVVDFPSAIIKNGSGLSIQQEEESKLAADHQSPLRRSANELEAEEEMIVEGADAQGHDEGYDQVDGDDDYEPVEGEDYTLDEGENGDLDDEYLDDDDDGDDFAKKLGVVSS
uniref:Zinc finger CCCH domain-containing protein 17 isoform X1 n=1 Tax=Nicotiana tabacum TaxID=4097 RepID=A0A1S4A1X7_TOBAC|nr:PREDICTED: zinc finger CCCH domain-containing protein 17-like isoform X1 [Nicotiana tabacum]XP_016470599.1 PREDICTED: zinc finger CCCH domain-containing protein 17-like isoform X2 [Nicotiana tabacum]